MKKPIPTLSLINNRKHSGNAKKPSPIEIRVTYLGKQKYISTGIKVLPSEWDKEASQVKRRSDATDLNEMLFDMKSKVLAVVTDLYKHDCLDLSKLGEVLKDGGSDSSFVRFCDKRICQMDKERSKSTLSTWRSWLALIERDGLFVTFEDVARDNIERWDRSMHDRGFKISTIAEYHKIMKAFVNEAVKRDLMKFNPYTKYGIQIEQAEPQSDRYLTIEEVERLSSAKMATETMDKVRDLFLFQCLTGLAYKDVMSFNKDGVQRGNDGSYIYVGKRGKTGVTFVVVLLPKALEILRKYNWQLPHMSNTNYNIYIKVIMQSIGVDKPVTTHWGRHTAAMVWLNSGIPLEVVSRCLGHSSTRITQKVYAHLENASIVKAFGNLQVTADWMK